MNHLLLDELQRQRCYPSITVLVNTTPSATLAPDEEVTVRRFLVDAKRRLTGDVDEVTRDQLLEALEGLVVERRRERSGLGLALCASPEYTAAIPLGKRVEERLVIDDTFATRDLVADLHRTARYRVITLSDRKVRVLVGDRRHLLEARDEVWPLQREEAQSPTSWERDVAHLLRAEHARFPLPTIVAGVTRSVRRLLGNDLFQPIGVIAGNHDRTSATDLHHAVWPLVTDWLRAGHRRGLERLEQARSARRYAGGINEVWPLARDGRVELLLVEEGFRLPARLGEADQLELDVDADAPDVVDDLVDDVIETVMRYGGETAILHDGDLDDHDRICAVLRY
jgi:hypothetical protein